MSFEQIITILAIVNAPLGIFLTWSLTERARNRRARDEAGSVKSAEQRGRVLVVAELAERIAGDARSLAHGIYLRKTRATPVGFGEMMESFNSARSAFDTEVLRLRVLGPSWAVEPAEKIQADALAMVEVLTKLEQDFGGADLERIQELLPTFDETVAAFIDLLASKYNEESGTLPSRQPHPDRSQ